MFRNIVLVVCLLVAVSAFNAPAGRVSTRRYRHTYIMLIIQPYMHYIEKLLKH